MRFCIETKSFMVDDAEKNVDSIQQLLRRLNTIVYHFINKDRKFSF